ncbi:MAG: Rrf2 family transcriptional regulator [Sulfurimonas sp.]|nr:Rrf2 family transcriptional regulator [Sulfurimonas sp.]
MEINKTSQYAIRILNYIANNSEGRLVSAKELAEVLEIPYKFLTKINTDLVKEGFIVSIRGREGGTKLARDASEISILQVLNAFNEMHNQKDCLLGIGNCDTKKRCALHDQWAKPKSMIQKMFEKTTLADMDGENFKI